MWWPSQIRPALAADPDLAALVVHAHPDAGGPTGTADDGHRGHRHRHELVDDASLHGGAGRLGMSLGHIHPFDDGPSLGGNGTDHIGLLAPVLAGQHLDLVTLANSHLQHLRCQRDDPHEALVAQLSAYRAEDAGPAWLLLIIDEDCGVLVEADVAPVWPALLLLRADDDALDHIALLHRGAGD